MKKLIFILVIIVLAICLYSYKQTKKTNEPTSQVGESTTQEETGKEVKDAEQVDSETGESEEESEEEIDVRPAVDVYKSADDALAAIKKAASKYDDVVLEQFYMLGNCSWCNKFYSDVKALMLDKSLGTNERTYYAEILSTTGKKENIQALVEATLGTSDATEKDMFSEALELSNLSNESLKYLADEYSNSTDVDLKEAIVGAISGQGTKESIEILYNLTTENGDADGFYSDGIGLGEVVPENSAYPFLEDVVTKRDKYAHLAVKALLNGGMDGTKLVMDILGNTKDSAADIKIFDLEKAADHVLYDDSTAEYLSSFQSPNEAQKYFIDRVIAASADDAKDDE